MFRLHLPAVPDSLRRVHTLARRLAAEATLPEPQAYRLRLATEELFTNIVQHGYGADYPEGQVVIEGDLTDDAVWIRLIDSAAPFDPVPPEPVPPEPPEPTGPGGFGLRLTHWAVDGVHYRYVNGTNRTTIMISRTAPTGASEQEGRLPQVRVLMLSWEYPPVLVGGLGRHVWSLSTAMVRAGHEVTVVSRHAPGAPVEEHLDGVRVLRAPEDPPLFPLTTPTLLGWAMAFNHGLTRAALRAAQTSEFDVVHAHDWLVAQTAVTLKEQLRLPLVATIHSTEVGRHLGWLPDEMNRRIHSMERWLGHEADRVVLCSDYMRREVGQLLGIDRERIDVIPNGVDLSLWQPDPEAVRRARRRYHDAGPLIGYAGRLVYEKGVQNLLYALPELRRRHPRLRLLVAGDGPHLAPLRELVERLDLAGAVTFAGFLGAELPAVIAATDVMVVPSIYEPFGMIALEAAAAGTPVAAAATGGLVEIVESGRTGLTFPAGTPLALVEAVSTLLRDPDSAGRMAANARRKVAERYSWTTVMAGVHGVYRLARAEMLGRLDGYRLTIPWYAARVPEHR